jgi:hypothetical protein
LQKKRKLRFLLNISLFIKILNGYRRFKPESIHGLPQTERIDLPAECMDNPPRHLAFVFRCVKPAPEASGRLETK